MVAISYYITSFIHSFIFPIKLFNILAWFLNNYQLLNSILNSIFVNRFNKPSFIITANSVNLVHHLTHRSDFHFDKKTLLLVCSNLLVKYFFLHKITFNFCSTIQSQNYYLVMSYQFYYSLVLFSFLLFICIFIHLQWEVLLLHKMLPSFLLIFL